MRTTDIIGGEPGLETLKYLYDSQKSEFLAIYEDVESVNMVLKKSQNKRSAEKCSAGAKLCAKKCNNPH